MGNKQILAQNNETLVSILSNVLGLPTQESLKHGAYVWKKYENKPEIIIGTASVVSNGIQITIPDSTGITEEYLDGAKFTTNLSLFVTFTLSYSNGAKTATCEDSTYNGTYSYINGVLTIINSSLASLPEIGASNLTFEKTFLDFTVSDSSTAYPDGGEQDGYWYEKVVEGKAGIDFGEVTLTTNLTEITVSHNLGVIPSIAAIMVANTTMPGFNETSLNINGNTAANSGSNYQLESNGTKITKTNSNVTFKSYSSTKPFMQATFFWIAVA